MHTYEIRAILSMQMNPVSLAAFSCHMVPTLDIRCNTQKKVTFELFDTHILHIYPPPLAADAMQTQPVKSLQILQLQQLQMPSAHKTDTYVPAFARDGTKKRLVNAVLRLAQPEARAAVFRTPGRYKLHQGPKTPSTYLIKVHTRQTQRLAPFGGEHIRRNETKTD